MSGSKGPLFYSAKQCLANVGAWNDFPLTGRHPVTDNGKHTSAAAPGMRERQGIGFITNDRIEGDKRRVDCWFDVAATKAYDVRNGTTILADAEAGKLQEVSTGLRTDDAPAQNGANHNGRGYTHVVTGWQPDHLAVLPDQRGACILPGQEIQGRIVGASKAWYSGKAIRIRTASGKVLAVTANHPILTGCGFVPANQLTEGQDLLHYTGKDESSPPNGNKENAPALSEDVFEALECLFSSKERKRYFPLDFHGDAAFFQGDVEVVNSKGALRYDSIAESTKSLSQCSLRGGRYGQSALSRGSSSNKSFDGVDAAYIGCIGGGGESLAILDAESGVHHPRRFRSVADYTHFSQPTVEGAGRDSSCLADSINTFSGEIGRDSLVDHFFGENGSKGIRLPLFCVFGPGAELDISLSELASDRSDVDIVDFGQGLNRVASLVVGDPQVDHLLSNDLLFERVTNRNALIDQSKANSWRSEVKLFRQLRETFPGKVFTDKVIGIDVFFHDGPVFDFETTTGYMIANKLIVSNCSIQDGCGTNNTSADAGEDCPKWDGRKKPVVNGNKQSIWQKLGEFLGVTGNEFCSTGPGGGVDPTCTTSGQVFRDAAGNRINPDNGLTPDEETSMADMKGIQPGRTFQLAEERELEARGKARLVHIDRVTDDPPRLAKPASSKGSDERLRKTMGVSKKDWKELSRDAKTSGHLAAGYVKNQELCQDCKEGEQCDVCKAAEETNNLGMYGNPQSQNTGRYKPHGSGTGKGPHHEAAQSGAMMLTDRDRELGQDAAKQLAETGHNPASWVADEATWEKAKTAAGKTYGEGDDAYWPAVAHIYKNMGGEVKGTTKNAELGAAVDIDDNALRESMEHLMSFGVSINADYPWDQCIADQLKEYGDKKTAEEVCGSIKAKNNSESGDFLDIFNSEGGSPVKLDDRQRKVIVTELTTNCACWKGGEETLNGMDDDRLIALAKSHKDAKTLEATANAFKEIAELVEAPKDLAINAMPAFIQKAIDKKKKVAAGAEDDAEDAADEGDDEDMETNAEERREAKRIAANTRQRKPQTSEQWLTDPSVPEDIRSAARFAMNAERGQKVGIVQQLVANVADDKQRERLAARYMKMQLPDLQDELATRPQLTRNQRDDAEEGTSLGFYFGGIGQPPAQNASRDEALDEHAELMDIPTLNFASVAGKRKTG